MSEPADFSAEELSELATEMRRMWHAMAHRAEHRERCEGPARQQSWVLSALGAGPRRMSDLAECAQTSQTSLTGIVDRLAERGLVERVRSDEDRRVVEVALTELGHTEMRHSHAKMLERLDEVLAPLSADERRELLRLTRVIAAHNHTA